MEVKINEFPSDKISCVAFKFQDDFNQNESTQNVLKKYSKKMINEFEYKMRLDKSIKLNPNIETYLITLSKLTNLRGYINNFGDLLKFRIAHFDLPSYHFQNLLFLFPKSKEYFKKIKITEHSIDKIHSLKSQSNIIAIETEKIQQKFLHSYLESIFQLIGGFIENLILNDILPQNTKRLQLITIIKIYCTSIKTIEINNKKFIIQSNENLIKKFEWFWKDIHTVNINMTQVNKVCSFIMYEI